MIPAYSSQATPRRRTIAIANQKGGVGKTTTAVNLGAGLAQKGFRTLVIDLDIQSNTTHVLFRPLDEHEEGMCEMILDERKLDSIIRETATPNLFLAPSGESLVHADLNLAAMMGRDSILRFCLDSEVVNGFDFVLIDTSPYLGLLTINALVAADYVLVPVSCEFLPLLGIKWLLRTIRQVREKLHPHLAILGYVLTMYDRREGITKDVEDILRDQFGDDVFDTRIRVNTKHKAAPSEHKTIYQYEGSASARGSFDYNRLTTEFLERLEAKENPSPASTGTTDQPATSPVERSAPEAPGGAAVVVAPPAQPVAPGTTDPGATHPASPLPPLAQPSPGEVAASSGGPVGTVVEQQVSPPASREAPATSASIGGQGGREAAVGEQGDPSGSAGTAA